VIESVQSDALRTWKLVVCEGWDFVWLLDVDIEKLRMLEIGGRVEGGCDWLERRNVSPTPASGFLEETN
jgi:hypothetical protein